MKYYTLNYQVDTEETGHAWPQISDDSPACREGRKDSFRKLDAYKFTDFVPNLEYYELDKEAKLTDMLSGGVPAGISGGIVTGFVISEKLKNIFQQFRHVPCNFYPATVKEGKVFHRNYYLMHIVSDLSERVNFQKSKFYIVLKITNIMGENALNATYTSDVDTN